MCNCYNCDLYLGKSKCNLLFNIFIHCQQNVTVFLCSINIWVNDDITICANYCQHKVSPMPSRHTDIVRPTCGFQIVDRYDGRIQATWLLVTV